MLKIHLYSEQLYESGITRKTQFIFQCCAGKTFHELVTHGIDFLIFCCFSIVPLSKYEEEVFNILGQLSTDFSYPKSNDFQHLKAYLTGTFHVRSYKIMIPYSRLLPDPKFFAHQYYAEFQRYLNSFTDLKHIQIPFFMATRSP